MQPDAFADMVVLTVKAALGQALGPVLERLAAAEAMIASWPVAEKTVAEIRDRVVAVETKAAIPAPAWPSVPDLAPVSARLAAAEALLATLVDLRDRVVTIETKAALPLIVPSAPDVGPLFERLAAAEARLATLGDLRDRVVTVETKAAVPMVPDAAIGELRDRLLTIETKTALPTAVDFALIDVKSRVTTLEGREAPVQIAAEPRMDVDLRDRFIAAEHQLKAVQLHEESLATLRHTITTEVSALRERIAVVEVRAQVPGPVGKDGHDGLDGKAGTDGLGWDDLSVVQHDERSFTVRCAQGQHVKALSTLTFPVEIYRGVYIEGKSYERGDGVTWGGSEWHANESTTTKPGDGSKAWILKVKRGRDGRDGRDAADAVPVVSVGGVR